MADEELLSLEDLTRRVGMTVRNVRFYTSRGLVPAPVRRGRSAYYTPDHVARLELVRELQGHGFTLAAIERYVAAIPDDARPEDITLHRTMLAPWSSEAPETLGRAELEERAGRSLTDDDLETLGALGIALRTKRGEWEVAASQLGIGVALLDLGFPTEAAIAASEAYAAHGRALAHEIGDIFRTMVWPAYREAGASPETIRAVVERLKPLSIASLVAAYESAIDEAKREQIAERARRAADPA